MRSATLAVGQSKTPFAGHVLQPKNVLDIGGYIVHT